MNDKTTSDKNKDSIVNPTIERRRSKIEKPLKVQKETNPWLGWLWCFYYGNNKINIKDKYESVIYMANEDGKDNLGNERKLEFNKSKSSDNVVRSSNSGNIDMISKRKSSIVGNGLTLSEQFLGSDLKINPLVATSANKVHLLKDYNKRRSWSILISRLESNKKLAMVDYKYKNTLGEHQTKINKSSKIKKGKNRGSNDFSQTSSNSGNGESTSKKLLSLKTEAAKVHKNSLMTGKHNMSNMNNTSNQIGIESSQGNAMKSNILITHKDTNQSSGMNFLNMDESVAPPLMIDNSATLFTNTKKYDAQNPKFKNFRNPLATETNKSEIDYQSGDGKIKRKRSGRSSYTASEGENDGEGESNSSSCSCSSWLRELNADNCVSLKMSQYSYGLAQGGFPKYETEDDSHMVNMDASGIMMGESTMNKDDTKTNLEYESIENFSKAVQEHEIVNRLINELDFSRPEYPDNLNNGKFKMKFVK
jgi:hypothetical protein